MMKDDKKNSQAISADYSAITTILSSSVTTIDTLKLFDINVKEESASPIDQFIKNNNALNLICDKNDPWDEVLANLVLRQYNI